MNHFFSIIIKFLNKYKFTLLGFSLFMVYFWDRLIRLRAPRDIPFQLNLFTLIILLFICMLYIYLLYRIFYPPQSVFMVKLLLKPLLFFLEAFKAFDNYIKSIPLIKKNYGRFLIDQVSKIQTWSNYSFYAKLLILFFFGPNLVLLVIFILDVFYFNKIQYFYYFIPLTIITLVVPYIIFSIQQYIEILIESIESKIDRIEVPFVSGVLPPEEEFDEEYDGPYIWMYLKLRIFLNHHKNQMYYANISENFQRYSYRILISNDYYAESEKNFNINNRLLSDKEMTVIREPLKKCIDDITQLNFIRESYDLTMYIGNDAAIHKMKPFKIILFSGYLTCWVYILIKSVYNSDVTLLLKDLIDISRTLEDPFIGEILCLPNDIFQFGIIAILTQTAMSNITYIRLSKIKGVSILKRWVHGGNKSKQVASLLPSTPKPPVQSPAQALQQNPNLYKDKNAPTQTTASTSVSDSNNSSNNNDNNNDKNNNNNHNNDKNNNNKNNNNNNLDSSTSSTTMPTKADNPLPKPLSVPSIQEKYSNALPPQSTPTSKWKNLTEKEKELQLIKDQKQQRNYNKDQEEIYRRNHLPSELKKIELIKEELEQKKKQFKQKETSEKKKSIVEKKKLASKMKDNSSNNDDTKN